MSLSVNVTITGTKEEIARLRNLGASLNDFSDSMSKIGDELKKYYSGQVFVSEGGVFGTPWKALSDQYNKQKLKRWRKGIMDASGTMRDSFIDEVSPGAVSITNSAPYFKYHQSTEERTIMPRRQMIGINDDVRSIVYSIINNETAEKVKASNG